MKFLEILVAFVVIYLALMFVLALIYSMPIFAEKIHDLIDKIIKK